MIVAVCLKEGNFSPSNDTLFLPMLIFILKRKKNTIWLKCCHSMLSFHPLNIIFYLVFPIRIHIFRINTAKWYLLHKFIHSRRVSSSQSRWNYGRRWRRRWLNYPAQKRICAMLRARVLFFFKLQSKYFM